MIKTARASLSLVFAAVVVLIIAAPVLATAETTSTTEGATQTTIVTTDIQPAVEVTVPPPDLAAEDWTYRYLVPTGILVAVLIVIATSGRYFTNVVRKRYRIVEE